MRPFRALALTCLAFTLLVGCQEAPEPTPNKPTETLVEIPAEPVDGSRFISAADVLQSIESRDGRIIVDVRARPSYEELRVAGAVFVGGWSMSNVSGAFSATSTRRALPPVSQASFPRPRPMARLTPSGSREASQSSVEIRRVVNERCFSVV